MRISYESIRRIVENALEEDIASGDVTTLSLISENAAAYAYVLPKQPGVIAGLPVAECVFKAVDRSVHFTSLVRDGAYVAAMAPLAEIKGPARALLTAERTALNFVQHLSGIATLTSKVVQALKGTRTTLLDTRKTTPGLRALEKYAVRCGGARNHRIGLFDGILIKNNHLKFNSLAESISRARRYASPLLKVEVEVETLDQLKEALENGVDIIMLDNMPLEIVARAVEITAGKALLEVSGKVPLEMVAPLAGLGVDFISMGALTHSAPALDISLRIEPESR